MTADDVNIGLGYVCVRNRIGEETYEEARMQEELLFRTHPMLSLIDEDIVGIPVLAQKLMLIQATMIGRCLPEIVRKINMKMETAVLELNKLPMVMASTGEAFDDTDGHYWFSKRVSLKDSYPRRLLRVP